MPKTLYRITVLPAPLYPHHAVQWCTWWWVCGARQLDAGQAVKATALNGLPVIRELQAAGATSHNAIAIKLNALRPDFDQPRIEAPVRLILPP